MMLLENLLSLLVIQKFLNAKNPSRIKILKKIVSFTKSGIYPLSAYNIRFEHIVAPLVEYGISNKWDAAYIPKAELPQNQLEQFKQESSLRMIGLKLTIILHVVHFLFLLWNQ